MANRNYFMNGITDLLILSMLAKKDCYVYEITKGIQNMSDGQLVISQNTIYTATYKLENEHCISEYSKLVGRKRTRVYYHIEEAGIKYLEELTASYQNIVTSVNCILDALEERGVENEDESDLQKVSQSDQDAFSGHGEKREELPFPPCPEPAGLL